MRPIRLIIPAVASLAIGLGAAACDRGVKANDPANPPAATAERPSSVGAAIETFDVKKALVAEKAVDASDINVDTFAETKTVVLKGSVPTAEQRDLAERIAMREATGYKVDNQLTVRAK